MSTSESRINCTFVSLALASVVALAGPSFAASCDMSEAFLQKDTDAQGGNTAVWADSAGNLMFVERLHVNTDGTKKSYSVDDFWGDQNALNNLCNAMSDACAGLSTAQKRARRIATQKAASEGWPRQQLKQTRLSPHIIPMPGGKPCAPVDGYLVSATALHAKVVTNPCALESYVDSLTTPAIVIPKSSTANPSQFKQRGVTVGDLVTAVSLDGALAVHGVVGDTGPVNKLGEASIAMNGKLLKRSGLPGNYREVRGKDEYKGKGWSAPQTFILIYARSKDIDDPYMTVDRIDPAAADRFSAWGGVERAQACIAEYQVAAAHTR